MALILRNVKKFHGLLLIKFKQFFFIFSKRTAFNRRTTNYKAWKEQMTVCELLEDYDPAVRPFAKGLSVMERSKFFYKYFL